MNIMTYLLVDTSYMQLENIVEMKITQSINQHGRLRLTAVIQEEKRADYILNVEKYEKVEIVYQDEEGQAQHLFKGIVQNMEVRRLKKVYYLFVDALTYSSMTDIARLSRSFQDAKMTYGQMLEKVMERYPGGEAAMKGPTGPIGKFILQYKETDWQFIKRIASHFRYGLVPSLLFDTPKITIGIPGGRHIGPVEKYHHYITKDYEWLRSYMQNEDNTNTAKTKIILTELDAVTIHIETVYNYEIGDSLTYTDQTDPIENQFFIRDKEIEFVDGALRYRYQLATENGFRKDKLYNEDIVGLSLQGRVLNRIQDTVEVHLEVDSQQDESRCWPFPYTTPYTAQGASGWYVMPEVGDTVYIYFPEREERFGVGVNSVRVQNTGTDKIDTPEIKYLRTPNGKEIKLAPGELTITACNGINESTGELKQIYIQLNDQEGITIRSTEEIHINSDKDIHFSADKNLVVEALESIELRCGPSQVAVAQGAVSISSPQVKLQE